MQTIIIDPRMALVIVSLFVISVLVNLGLTRRLRARKLIYDFSSSSFQIKINQREKVFVYGLLALEEKLKDVFSVVEIEDEIYLSYVPHGGEGRLTIVDIFDGLGDLLRGNFDEDFIERE